MGCRMDYPQCAMIENVLDFWAPGQTRCSGQGKYAFWRWPGRELCFFHYHEAVEIFHLLDSMAEGNRLARTFQINVLRRTKGLKVLGESIDDLERYERSG